VKNINDHGKLHKSFQFLLPDFEDIAIEKEEVNSPWLIALKMKPVI